jgi:hypothetical protein
MEVSQRKSTLKHPHPSGGAITKSQLPVSKSVGRRDTSRPSKSRKSSQDGASTERSPSKDQSLVRKTERGGGYELAEAVQIDDDSKEDSHITPSNVDQYKTNTAPGSSKRLAPFTASGKKTLHQSDTKASSNRQRNNLPVIDRTGHRVNDSVNRRDTADNMKDIGTITVKRRTASNTKQRTNVKRPKLLGPFIDDSNSDSDSESESDEESGCSNDEPEYDNDEEDYCDTRPVAQVPKQVPSNTYKATPSTATPPPKPVVWDRIKKFMNQKQSGNEPIRYTSFPNPTKPQKATAPFPALNRDQVLSTARADRGTPSRLSNESHRANPSPEKVTGSNAVSDGFKVQRGEKSESVALLKAPTKTNAVPSSTSNPERGIAKAPAPAQNAVTSPPVRRSPHNPRLLKAIGAKYRSSSNMAVTKSNRQHTTSNRNVPGGARGTNSGFVGGILQDIRQSGQPSNVAANNNLGVAVAHGSESIQSEPIPDELPVSRPFPRDQLGQNVPSADSPRSTLHQNRAGSMKVTTDGPRSENKQARNGTSTSTRTVLPPNAPGQSIPPGVPKSQAPNTPSTGQKRKAENTTSEPAGHPPAKRPTAMLVQSRPPSQPTIAMQGKSKTTGYSSELSGSKSSATTCGPQKVPAATLQAKTNPQISAQNAVAQQTPAVSSLSSTANLHQQPNSQVQSAHGLTIAGKKTFVAAKVGTSPAGSSTGGQSQDVHTNAVKRTIESVNAPTKGVSANATTATKGTTGTTMGFQLDSDRKSSGMGMAALAKPASVQTPPKIRMKTVQVPRSATSERTGRNASGTQPGKSDSAAGQHGSVAAMTAAQTVNTPPTISKQPNIPPTSSPTTVLTDSIKVPSFSGAVTNGTSRASSVLSRSSRSEHGSQANTSNSTVLPAEQQMVGKRNENRPITEVPAPKISEPTSTVVDLPKPTPKLTAEPELVEQQPAKDSQPTTASLTRTIIPQIPRSDSPLQPPIPIRVQSTLPSLPTNAEPYFEYSIFQKIWPASAAESFAPTTELSLRPSSSLAETNKHAEKLFCDMRDQYQQHFGMHFTDWTNKRDDHGCNTHTGTFAPFDYPGKQSHIKLWVQRDYVSAYAGRTAQEMANQTSFVAKTVYVLRLFQLLAPESESEDSSTATEAKRVFYPLTRTECYTTLEAANRAAQKMQIELSHKANPTAMDALWQKKNAEELREKLKGLEEAGEGGEKFWKSDFNGSGLGSVSFELVVEKVGLCGPRNL